MAKYGGMETHICLVASLCAQVFKNVTLITTSNSLNDEARQRLLDSAVHFVELPEAQGTASHLRKFTWLISTIRRLRATNWDLIYSNGQSALAPITWLAARRGSRITHHHHTAADSQEQQTWHPLFKCVLRFAPELVACSNATRKELESALQRTDVACIPYLTRGLMPADAVVDRSYHADTILNFGFVGRLVSTKGIEAICKLSQSPELTDIRWHVHGEGKDYPPSFFEKYPNVTYHGRYRSAEEHAAALNNLDAVVLLSTHSEGLPLSLIEAMAAGLPWMATDRGGTRELGVSAQNCLVVPADASLEETQSLAKQFAARIRAGGTSRSEQRRAYDTHFSPQIIGQHWLQYFGSGEATSRSDRRAFEALLPARQERN